MIEEDFLREPTWKEWLILKKIAICKKNTPTYKKDWADRIEAKPNDPIFSNAINILKASGIAESRQWIANYNVIDINIKKLDLFIEKTEVYQHFREYAYNKQLIVIGV